MSKSIDKAGIDEVPDSLTLFFGVSGVMLVIFWASEVERSMSSVKIAADYDWLYGFKFF